MKRFEIDQADEQGSWGCMCIILHMQSTTTVTMKRGPLRHPAGMGHHSCPMGPQGGCPRLPCPYDVLTLARTACAVGSSAAPPEKPAAFHKIMTKALPL